MPDTPTTDPVADRPRIDSPSLAVDPTDPTGGTPTPSAPANSRRRVATVLALILVAVIAAAAVALLASSASETATAAGGWRGTVLERPQELPEIVLRDVEGRPVDLSDSDAAVTLLMFGYTNCPDICPISLATLTSALAALPPEQANQVRLYFVTADPERDTPDTLAEYIAKFDRRFTGLTGSVAEVDAAQELARVPAALREEPDEDGNYAVGHATQMIAYQRDQGARIVYPFGTREQDWTRDLPRLIAGERPVPEQR